MKHILTLLFSFTLSIANGQEIDLSQFRLTFSDEFDGDKLDATKWQAPEMPRQGSCRWVTSLATVSDGALHLGIRLSNDPVLRYRRLPGPRHHSAPKGPWPYAEGKALPITKVRVEAQGQMATGEVAGDADLVRLRLTLKAGPTDLKTAFLDAQGAVLCGAYYTDVQFERAEGQQ